MNLNFLSSFVDLCETLSFSKTAQRLNTVQPVISRHIKELESTLGYQLFIRTRKQVRLTEEGREFKNKVVPIYINLLASLNDANKKDVTRKTIVRIGCTIEAGENVLYPILKPHLDENSSYQIQISLLGTAEIFKKMADGDLDIGIVTRTPIHMGMTTLDFIKERPLLIGPPQEKLSFQNLEVIPLVTYREQDHFANEFLERNFPKNIRKKVVPVFSINSHRLMIDFVRNNTAFAVIPESSAKDALSSKQIKIYAEDKRSFILKLVYKNSLKQDFKKSAFISWLSGKLK